MSFLARLNRGYGFRQYFRIDAALDDTRREDVYRIRHEVYCEELKFEPEQPDRRETDDYDAQSKHCLMTTAHDPHRLVGCTRLVLTNATDPDALLPFERTCATTLNRSIIDPARLPRGRIAEVSRLAVRRIYRRRMGEERDETLIHTKDFGTTMQPRFPYIPIGLYMGAISLAIHNDVDHLFVLTEPRLAQHFARLGIDIRQIGGPISQRGTRIPSVIDVRRVIRDMRFTMKPLWRTVNEEIESSISPPSMLH